MSSLTILQLKKRSYSERTRFNAVSTDATLYFATRESTGSALTKHYAGNSKFLFVKVDQALILRGPTSRASREVIISAIRDEIFTFIKGRYDENKGKIKLNIAGNRMAYFDEMNETSLAELVLDVLSSSKNYIKEIASGGQTGADIAGAVVGCVMGIPTRVAFPKKYRQQTSTGNVSTDRTLEEIVIQIQSGIESIWDVELSPVPSIISSQNTLELPVIDCDSIDTFMVK